MKICLLFLNLSLLSACLETEKDNEIDTDTDVTDDTDDTDDTEDTNDTDDVEDTDDEEDTDDTDDTDDVEDTDEADCIEIDLGTTSGDALHTGDASTADNTYNECGESTEGITNDTSSSDWLEGMGNDTVLSWTAPATMTYTIQTIGSSELNEDTDTVLTVLSSAECLDGLVQGQLVGCNDDFIGLDSGVVIDAVAGETYVIIVDMYDEDSNGDWVLNITEGAMESEYMDMDTGSWDSGSWDTGMTIAARPRLKGKAALKYAAKHKRQRPLVRKQSMWSFVKQTFNKLILFMGL